MDDDEIAITLAKDREAVQSNGVAGPGAVGSKSEVERGIGKSNSSDSPDATDETPHGAEGEECSPVNIGDCTTPKRCKAVIVIHGEVCHEAVELPIGGLTSPCEAKEVVKVVQEGDYEWFGRLIIGWPLTLTSCRVLVIVQMMKKEERCFGIGL